MEKYITELMTLAQNCNCENHHYPIPIEKIIVADGALEQVVPFIKSKSFKHAVIIADENTFTAAGKSLSYLFNNANIGLTTSLVQPDENNDVVADEKSLIQALLEIPQKADVIVAVGAGTLHDIARFCSTKMGMPFISVPTAPSVDGFTSMGAPLIIRGVKTTFQMTAPIAVFADISVLKSSPPKMIAAGFGDMLAKYTSLADWTFSHLVKGEPYCPLVASITRDSLKSTMDKAEKIAKADDEGIQILIEALIKSGLAMLIFGQSHPASGGEHHLSHYWEMEFLKQNRPAVLHGAKVAVSTILLSKVYKKEFLDVITDNKRLDALEDNQYAANIRANIQEIISAYREIPNASKLEELLVKMGGGILPEQLGIDESLVQRSLLEAHQLRNRFTALKFLNEVIKVNHTTVN